MAPPIAMGSAQTCAHPIDLNVHKAIGRAIVQQRNSTHNSQKLHSHLTVPAYPVSEGKKGINEAIKRE